MLTAILGFIPILGPIIQAIGGIVSSFLNVGVEKYKTDADVAKTEIQASTQTLQIFHDDWGVRLGRDIVMWPGSVWCCLYVWDKIVDHRYPDLVWNVASLDGPLAMLPFALLTFYFGLAAMNIWKLK